MKLNNQDYNLILESLEYTRFKYENSDKHPTYEFKQEQLKKVNDLIFKIKEMSKNRER